jgi:hypothetical protein
MEGDVIIDEQQQVELTQEQIDFNAQMAFALGEEGAPVPIQPVAEIITSDAEPTPVVVDTIDYTPFIKENFALETVDEFKAEWDALQALKAAPKTEFPKFDNEFSEKLFTAIQQGKVKEVYESLAKQENIDRLTEGEVTAQNADEIIKLGMMQNEIGLTEKEINHEFKKMFSIPKEPVQSISEDDTEFEERMAEWKEKVEDINISKIIEAKKLKPKLIESKSKIIFPEIQQNTDQEYEDWKAQKASRAETAKKIENILVPAVNALKESDVNFNFKVNDANNKMDFEVALAPTPEQFEKAKQNSLFVDDYLNSVCYDENGVFTPAKLQRMILINDNFDNYVQSAVRQAVNAERKAVITKETEGNGIVRDINTTIEETEFQKNMRLNFM